MEIKKAYLDDFESIYPLLNGFNNSNISKSDWKKLFKKKFNSKYDFFGYYILADNKYVGFIGLIFSERKINGETIDFVNLTSWIVLPEYRQFSLPLLMKALSTPKAIYTNLSANPNLWELFKRLKFNLVDEFFYIIPPISLYNNLKVIIRFDEMQKKLNDGEIQIINDHNNLNFKPFFFYNKNTKLLVLVSNVQKKKLKLSQVLYVSNKQTFTQNIYKISKIICWNQKTFGLYVGNHFTSKKPIINYKIKRKTFFRGTGIDKGNIDYLYSELT